MINKNNIGDKSIRIIYFSDPICSACWGVEPLLRKLKLDYGKSIDFEYHMGGLLPSWEQMGDRVNPSVLASHSDEMSQAFQMPMNGNIWLENPPQSSYPPSIAFKTAQIQDEEKAIQLLRKIREDLYVIGINIAECKYLTDSAMAVGLNMDQFIEDYNNQGKSNFEGDLILAQKMGVRGFPCFYISNGKNESKVIYGIKPYSEFEQSLREMDESLEKNIFSGDSADLFNIFPSVTTKEYADLSSVSYRLAEDFLTDLAAQNKVNRISTKNGDLWTVNSAVK